MNTLLRYLRLLLFSALLCVWHGAVTAGPQREYTVGIVPQFDARRIYDIWRPILDELQAATGVRFTIRGSPDIPSFEKEFLAGSFDFAYMNPYHVLLAHDRQGYRPLARDVGRQLHGVLVVHKQSPIRSVKQLAGKTVAFPAPNALGASLMVRADLLDQFDTRIVPRYVNTHSSVYLNVVLQQTDAGGGVQKTFRRQPAEVRNKLRVLYRTRSVAPHPFCAHPRVPMEVQTKVREAYLNLGRSERGRAILARVPIKEIGPASMADYRPLAAMGLERFYQK